MSTKESPPLPPLPEGSQLPVYVLYNDKTSDFPGEWVVRRQCVTKENKIYRDKELTARGPSRDAAIIALNEAVPATLHMMFLKRHPTDDACIDGSFL